MSHSLQHSTKKDFTTRHTTSTNHTSAQHGYHNAEEYSSINEDVFPLDSDEVYSTIITEDIELPVVDCKGKSYKGKNRVADEDEGSDSSEERVLPSPIANLPLEILARVLANLDPASLLLCTAVCRTFAVVAKDDATWRLAFSFAFRIEDIGSRTTPILRRVDATSWKAEYTRRSELVRWVPSYLLCTRHGELTRSVKQPLAQGSFTHCHLRPSSVNDTLNRTVSTSPFLTFSFTVIRSRQPMRSFQWKGSQRIR
jgi:hypothetical protein